MNEKIVNKQGEYNTRKNILQGQTKRQVITSNKYPYQLSGRYISKFPQG